MPFGKGKSVKTTKTTNCPARKRAFAKTFNAVHASGKPESSAFAIANTQAKKTPCKKGKKHRR